MNVRKFEAFPCEDTTLVDWELRAKSLAQMVINSSDARSLKDWDALHLYLSEAAQAAREIIKIKGE